MVKKQKTLPIYPSFHIYNKHYPIFLGVVILLQKDYFFYSIINNYSRLPVFFKIVNVNSYIKSTDLIYDFFCMGLINN